jgi:hypothetical protein
VGYSNLYMLVLCRISGTALNLIVMQRLISTIATIAVVYSRAYAGGSHSAHNCSVCGAYPFTFLEFYRTLNLTGTNDH